MIVKVDPVTNITWIDLQEIAYLNGNYTMTAESLPGDDSFVSPTEGIISVKFHIGNLIHENGWGGMKIVNIQNKIIQAKRNCTRNRIERRPSCIQKQIACRT